MTPNDAHGFSLELLTIPHERHREPWIGVGDWHFEPGTNNLTVRVSGMGAWKYEVLVGLHEAIEAVLCRAAGVSQEDVDAFDREFEEARAASVGVFAFRGRSVHPDAEPGDQPDAPYYKAHQLATSVERMLAAEMGVKWTLYEGTVNDL